MKEKERGIEVEIVDGNYLGKGFCRKYQVEAFLTEREREQKKMKEGGGLEGEGEGELWREEGERT